MSDYLSSCLRPLFITFISGPYRHIPRLRDRASKPGESQHYGFVRAEHFLLPGPAGPSDHMGGSKNSFPHPRRIAFWRSPFQLFRFLFAQAWHEVAHIHDGCAGHCGCSVGLIIRKEWGIENEIVRAEQMGFMNYQVSSVIRISQENRALAEGVCKTRFCAPSSSWRRILTLRKQRTSRTTTVLPKAKSDHRSDGIAAEFSGWSVPEWPGADTGDEPARRWRPVFPACFQQIGQGNTSDAEFAVNSSIYPTGTVAMSTGFGNKELPGLPRLLNKHGYVTTTFHVNDVKFWDRSKMYPALDFQHYYDKPYLRMITSMSLDLDEELFRVGVDKLLENQQQNKPTYAHYITVSNHSPYHVKDEFAKITLPAELEGTHLGIT